MYKKKAWKEILTIVSGKSQKSVETINGKYLIYGSGELSDMQMNIYALRIRLLSEERELSIVLYMLRNHFGILIQLLV